MAWDIGADEYSSPATTYTRQIALDAALAPLTKTATVGIDAYLYTTGGAWDIGADQLSGGGSRSVSLDARIVDLTSSQTLTASIAAALAPRTPSGLTVDNVGVTWVALSWTDNSGGTAQHRVYYRKIGESTYTEWGLFWFGDVDTTVRYLTPGQTYVFAVAAVSTDGVEGPIITVTQATSGGAEVTTGLGAVVQDTVSRTCNVSAFISYGASVPGRKTVTGQHV